MGAMQKTELPVNVEPARDRSDGITEFQQPASIVRSMDTRCSYCHRILDLTEVIHEMISRMAARLANGKRVEIPGIGTLRPKSVGERRLKSIDGVTKMIPGWVQIRFRAAERIKAMANQGRKAGVANDEQRSKGRRGKGRRKSRAANPNNG